MDMLKGGRSSGGIKYGPLRKRVYDYFHGKAEEGLDEELAAICR